MIKICICDDDIVQSSIIENRVENFCKLYNLSHDIEVFNSSSSLLNYLTKEKYHIYLLDMEMGNVSGIDIAKAIRKDDEDCLIIYITNHKKYALESFKVLPFRYILKPLSPHEIENVFIDAIENLNSSKKFLSVKDGTVNHRLRVNEIMYILSENGRNLNIITRNSEDNLIVYGKIKEIEKNLSSPYFVKINQGTIININHIKTISNTSVKMLDDSILYISRSRKKHVSEAYKTFLEMKVGI